MTDDPMVLHVADDDLSALALGLLTGELRSAALGHVASCAKCSAVLEQYSHGVDGLLQIAPELDPPVGFEVRVLERMGRERPPIRTLPKRRSLLSAVAAAAIVTVAGIGIGHFAIGSSLATPTTNAAASSHSPLAASLSGDGHSRGTVVVFGGSHPWLLMTMHSVRSGTLVICRVQTRAGNLFTVGSYWITSESDSWSAQLPVASTSIESVIITSQNGDVIARTSKLT